MRRAGRWIAGAYLAAFLVFMLAPLFFIVVNSFNDAVYSVFPPEGVSLRWYRHLLERDEFLVALRNSAIVAAIVCGLALTLGTGVALAIVRGRWARREIVQSLFLTPLLVPRVVIGVAALMMAIEVSLYPSFTSTVLAHTVLVMPYAVSILVASLLQVDRVQEEAATDLGANGWQTFRLATLPQIYRGALVAGIFTFIVSFDEFDIALFLSRSENMTLPVRMFLYMQEQENPTMAAMSTLLIAITAVLVILIMQVTRGVNLVSLLGKRGG